MVVRDPASHTLSCLRLHEVRHLLLPGVHHLRPPWLLSHGHVHRLLVSHESLAFWSSLLSLTHLSLLLLPRPTELFLMISTTPPAGGRRGALHV